MEEPKDSLNFEIGWFKATAVGRFTIVSVLTFLLVLAAFGWLFGLGQVGKILPEAASHTAIGK